MAYLITTQCIGCSRCQSLCPTGAITQNQDQYQIDSNLCNNCEGSYSIPQCWAVCPTNGACIPDVEAVNRYNKFVFNHKRSGDYWETWFSTYNTRLSYMKSIRSSQYWEEWFEAYSEQLCQSLHNSNVRSKSKFHSHIAGAHS